MTAPEQTPLWDSVTHPLVNALELAFGCHHSKLSRVFTINGRSYKVCCECGAKFDYSLKSMEVVSRHLRFPTFRRLRARQRRKRYLQRSSQRA